MLLLTIYHKSSIERVEHSVDAWSNDSSNSFDTQIFYGKHGKHDLDRVAYG